MLKLGQALSYLAQFYDNHKHYDVADAVHSYMIKLSQEVPDLDGRPLQNLLNPINAIGTSWGAQNGMAGNNPLASPTTGLNQPLMPPTPPGPNATQEEWNQYMVQAAQVAAQASGALQPINDKFAKLQADQAYYSKLQEGGTYDDAVAAGKQTYQEYIEMFKGQSQQNSTSPYNQSTQPTQAPQMASDGYPAYNFPTQ